MRRAVAIAAVALAGLAAAPAQAAAAPTVTDANALERAVVARVNTIRKNRGLQALALRPRLKRAGEAHARNMARNGYFAHSWSDGTAFGRWIRRFWPGPGYRTWGAGENLYWEGPSTNAKRVVRGWMKSPGHRRNMLSRSWTSLGVGAVRVTNGTGPYARVSTAFVVALELGSRSG